MAANQKIFISYNPEDDEKFAKELVTLLERYFDAYISKSVSADPQNPPALMQTFRKMSLKDSFVTLVLIGKNSWKKKEIDWEIATSLQYPRSGLVGITLPTHPNLDYKPGTVPPRFHYNLQCGYAALYNWGPTAMKVKSWIDEAAKRAERIEPDESYPLFTEDKEGDSWQ